MIRASFFEREKFLVFRAGILVTFTQPTAFASARGLSLRAVLAACSVHAMCKMAGAHGPTAGTGVRYALPSAASPSQTQRK